MFHQDTVFILGAGASWHYGYPTGEKLVRDVIEEAESLSAHYERWRPYGQFLTAHAKNKVTNYGTLPAPLNAAAKEDCDNLVRKLRSLNPLVIDYFLAQNPSLQDVGRFIIALVILKADATWSKERANVNRRLDLRNSPYKEDRERHIDITKCKDDWCRFVIYHMTNGCRSFADVRKNKLNFITFNYDTSLERRLFEGLYSIEIFQDGTAEDFFTDDRIIHVYGHVGSHRSNSVEVVASPLQMDDLDSLNKFVRMCDAAYDAAKNLRTIDPLEKEADQRSLQRARDLIAGAKWVYILGYGFDTNNNNRLQLARSLSSAPNRPIPTVCFTNFGDSNRVDERVSNLLFNGTARFESGYHAFRQARKSVRNAYEALEMDFEFPT
jgi:hypothetical protein